MKLRKIIIASIFGIIMYILLNTEVYAASFSVTSNKKELKKGETATITIQTVECVGKFSFAAQNGNISVSTSSEFIDGTYSFTITANSVGTSGVKVTATDVTDQNLTQVTGTKSVSINVVGKPVIEPEPKPEPVVPSAPLSSNANLSRLSIAGLTPNFSPSNTNYTVKVGSDVSKLAISLSTAEDAGTFKITGNSGFEEGNNIVNVISIAPNGAQKTYKITVVKEAKVEITEKPGNIEEEKPEEKPEEEPKEIDLTLKSLVISEIELNPIFDSNVSEYTSKYNGDSDMLEVIATASDPKAEITVSGNENIAMGENKIVVSVSSKDGEESKIYTIVVTKEEKVEEKIEDNTEVKEVESTDIVKQNNTQMYIVGGISIGIITILIVLIIITIRKKDPVDFDDDIEEEKFEKKVSEKISDKKGKRFK